MFHGEYTDAKTTPLFAFGHGLTYTTFSYDQPEVVSADTTAEPVVVAARVTNTGGRRGSEVVQLYVRDLVASVVRPYQQLVGFARVELEPGATATVTFEVHPSRLAFFDADMRFVIEPGTFRFAVGGAADTARQRIDVEVRGEVREHRQRDVVATTVSVS